jgi:hypothetical protein
MLCGMHRSSSSSPFVSLSPGSPVHAQTSAVLSSALQGPGKTCRNGEKRNRQTAATAAPGPAVIMPRKPAGPQGPQAAGNQAPWPCAGATRRVQMPCMSRQESGSSCGLHVAGRIELSCALCAAHPSLPYPLSPPPAEECNEWPWPWPLGDVAAQSPIRIAQRKVNEAVPRRPGSGSDGNDAVPLTPHVSNALTSAQPRRPGRSRSTVSDGRECFSKHLSGCH